MRITFVCTGLEHLGVEALMAYVRLHGHEPVLVYEPRLFSTEAGPDSPLLAEVAEPTPEQTAAAVLETRPDVVAFSSFTVTHRWCLKVARAVKREAKVPVLFGGPHVTAVPEIAVRDPAVDAVVVGEGEEALRELLESVGRDGFERTDVANVVFKGDGAPIVNPPRPLIRDLDALPFGDKSGFYERCPALEREFLITARRGCPFHCAYCEYSWFGRRYPKERRVRRRSVTHLIRELALYKRRGRMRKVFFWDPVFTMDPSWMEEFAATYPNEIGLPFECYGHPDTITPRMAELLGAASCQLVRLGVETLVPETLARLGRRAGPDRVRRAVTLLRRNGVPCSVDHIVGFPGEGLSTQLEAARFYNEVRPDRILVHWMTYLPGTVAFDEARRSGVLDEREADRIARGEEERGFDEPRPFPGCTDPRELGDMERLVNLFDLLPVLPRGGVEGLLRTRAWRLLPRGRWFGQVISLMRVASGNVVIRERLRTLLLAVFGEISRAARPRFIVRRRRVPRS